MNKLFAALFLFGFTQTIHAQKRIAPPSLIPYPQKLVQTGGSFRLTPATQVTFGEAFSAEAAYLQKLLKDYFHAGKALDANASAGGGTVRLQRANDLAGSEAYRLTVGGSGVTLSAADGVGMFRAVHTLQQLLPVQPSPVVTLPGLRVEDAPAYPWRGLMLDVSRHFFSTDFVKRLMDAMAFYKLNKLHLHLTDDQGWRIEIKKYPKLTEEGAWRRFNKQDSACLKAAADDPFMRIDPQHIKTVDGKPLYGGFYTQADVKELLAYAAVRHIEVIPELDMPGHMLAAIASYPFLSCTGQGGQGKDFSIPICPCKEETYSFVQNIFDEIIALFPSPYVHLGADEVEKITWEESTACKELMRREGLKNAAELQSYFVRRMQAYFTSKGKKMIAWDEALEGGVSPAATIMYWRDFVSPRFPLQALQNGNDVVYAPTGPLYFDYPENKETLAQILRLWLRPPQATPEQARKVLGAQGQLWTELVPSEQRAGYLYFPRSLALADRLWNGGTDPGAFKKRLPAHFNWLDKMGFAYRLPDLEGFAADNVFVGRTELKVAPPIPGATLRYTLNGTAPTVSSTVLKAPLTIANDTTVRLAAFTANGLRGPVYTLRYRRTVLREPVTKAGASPGLAVSYARGEMRSARLMAARNPDTAYVANDIGGPSFETAPSFGLAFNGYLSVPQTGIYTFYLTCDDGGVLRIGNEDLIDNDGFHAPRMKSAQAALKKGLHPLQLLFAEGGGGYTLKLQYSGADGVVKDVPAEWLRH